MERMPTFISPGGATHTQLRVTPWVWEYHKKAALKGRHTNRKAGVSPLQGCLYAYTLTQG